MSDGLPENFIFQQDNAPAHTAAGLRGYFENDGVRTLIWPSRSPDLNPIEHVWDAIARNINSKPQVADSLQQLQEWVQLEWTSLPQDYVDGLISSLPRRVRAVIESHGQQTKY